MEIRQYFHDPVIIDRMDINIEPDDVTISLLSPGGKVIFTHDFENIECETPEAPETVSDMLRRLATQMEAAK